MQHHDWLPTFLAMAGDPDVVEKLKKGYKAIGRTYKNHIDGYQPARYLTGKAKKSPRQIFFYFSDDGDMLAIRYDNWKIVFMEQRAPGHACRSGRSRSPGCACRRSSTCARIPTSAPTSPRTPTTIGCFINVYFIYAAQLAAAKFVETFKEFPPAQHPGSFTIDAAMAKMSEAASGANH